MTARVRIIRKRKSDLAMTGAWIGAAAYVLDRVFLRPQREANFNAMEELKAQNLQLRGQLDEMRKQKASNDVVLGDLKIEEAKLKLQLLQRKVDSLGTPDSFAPPSDYGK